MRFRVYIAVSLDGYVATPDGRVEWLESFQNEDYGYSSFIKEIGTIIMGRTTFEQVRGFGQWPYPDVNVFVLSSRSLEAMPANTSVWRAPLAELLTHVRQTGSDRDVWVLGRPKTINDFSELGTIDSYELFVIPILLGDGIPLFRTSVRQKGLELKVSEAYGNGVVRLVYEPM